MFTLRLSSADSSVRRRAGALALAGLLAAAALAGLGGCAGQSARSSNGMTEEHTASDDTKVRNRAHTHLVLAADYFRDDKASVALDEAKKAMQIDPSFSDAYDLAGAIYMTMGNLQLAQEHFERALSLNPRRASAMYNMGYLKYLQKQYAAAIEWFQRAIAQPDYSNRSMAWLMQATCQIASGDKTKAEATLLQAYELDPGNPVTGYTLAKLLYERGDYTRAQFYIRRINNSELANAQSFWLGIRVEHRLDNRVAMEQLASQLRRRFADSPELQSYQKGAFDE